METARPSKGPSGRPRPASKTASRLAAPTMSDQVLRQIHDWRPLPAALPDALLLWGRLCAAVREFRADAKVGECKGWASATVP
jgi:hypothetical protein